VITEIIAFVASLVVAGLCYKAGEPTLGTIAFFAINIMALGIGAGTRSRAAKSDFCPLCQGTGIWSQPLATPVGPQITRTKCHMCNGTGRVSQTTATRGVLHSGAGPQANAVAPAASRHTGSPTATKGVYYVITAQHSGKALDVNEGSRTAGAIVHQWAPAGVDSQRWKLVDTADGYYNVVAKHSGMCLDVKEGSTEAGAAVLQWPRHGGENQKWKLETTPDGYYKFIAKHSGMCLDVKGGGMDDGTPVLQWPVHSGENQKWALHR
jgi:hypothetical protein